MKTIYEHATDLVEHGLTVVPLSAKGTYIKGWTTATADELLKIDNWRSATGVGLVLGEASGVICLDIDITDDASPELLQIRKELDEMLPPLYSGVKGSKKKPTARFFKYNNERSRRFQTISIEILSTGTQKAIPPSLHTSSAQYYEWDGFPLDEVDADDLPDLPDYVLNFIEDKHEEMKFKLKSEPMSKQLTPVKGRCHSGSHNMISKYALSLIYRGYMFDDVVDMALEHDQRLNENAESIYFLCKSRRWRQYDNPRINAMKFVGEMFGRNIDVKFENVDFFKDSLANGFTWHDPQNTNARPVRCYIDLYNYMKLKLDTWYVPEIRSFYVWDGRKYQMKPDDFVRKYAQDHFKNPSCISINEKNTFLDYAKNAQQCSNDKFLLHDRNAINLENGVYDMTQKRLVGHHTKFKFPYLVPYNYVPIDDCPVWDHLLDVITLGRNYMKIAIEEFIGYIASGCSYNVFNKLLILDGDGSNGKSTLIRIIQELIGSENTSSVGLTDISTQRFAGFSLVNKLVNFCSEEPKDAFSNTGAIKKITGGDSFMVEEKHKGAFQYSNIAKLIISYNKMPFFPDGSSGMRRRIILIPCEQNFEKNPQLKLINPEKQILTKEADALLSRCIRRFEDVCARGSFTPVDEGVTRLNQMITDSDPILGFIADELLITKEESDFLSIGELYNSFCDAQGKHTKWTKRSFIRRLREELKLPDSFNDATSRISGTKVKGLRGVAFSSR